MREWLKWLWCALRDHPYPKIASPRDYNEPMICWEPPRCSNCGASIEYRKRGMHS